MTMRKSWFVAAAAAAFAAAAAGATLATYADSERATPVAAGAGTLTIDVKAGGTGANVDWVLPEFVPEYDGLPSAYPQRALITNTGTVPGSLVFRATELVDHENDCVHPEQVLEGASCGATGELSRQLQVAVEVLKMNDAETACTGTVNGQAGVMSLAELARVEHPANLTVQPGKKACLRFSFLLPEEPTVTEPVTNAVQSDSADFTMWFALRTR